MAISADFKPLETIQIGDVKYPINEASDEVQRLCGLYNFWMSKRADSIAELTAYETAMRTLVNDIVEHIKKDAGLLDEVQDTVDEVTEEVSQSRSQQVYK